MSKKSLQQQWQEVCNDYLLAFCKRHGYTYDPQDWVGVGAENIGTIVCANDMYVNMDEIRYDVDNNVPTDKFRKWYWKQLELHELGIEVWLNYPSYCQGAPDEWTEERMCPISRQARWCLTTAARYAGTAYTCKHSTSRTLSRYFAVRGMR